MGALAIRGLIVLIGACNVLYTIYHCVVSTRGRLMSKPEFKEKIDRNIFHNDPKEWIETIADIFMAIVFCAV